MAQALRRKLTTILSADVAGYSRLMDGDEVATVETLKAYRGAIDGFVERHRGRVVSTAGDGLLADFDSVVEAVQCAAEIQRELSARNTGVAEARRMAFRIGINLGDVIVEDEDIYGEGVNVAARLQGLAEPGGICISGTVFDQVRNKLSLGYDFLGPQAVKNIAEPVRTYRVLLGGEGAAAAARPREASADAGYYSAKAVEGLYTLGVDPFIPPDKTRHGVVLPPAPRGRIPDYLSPADRMRRKLRTKRGKQRYALRMGTVEPVFGQIKQARGFRQFLLRGLEKVQQEWRLICAGHNLLKLFAAVRGSKHRKAALAVA